MSISTILAIYFLIWWLTLFAVLPFGMQKQAEAAVVPGTDPGAPRLHVMWRKLGWTTVMATVIFAVLYVSYTRNWLPLDWLAAIATPPSSY
jgi:predicted secreted protein